MSKSFEEEIQSLRQETEMVNNNLNKKKKGLPVMLIAGCAVPILIIFILYILQPSFVQRQDGEDYIRDNTKLFKWSLLISVIIWIIMYIFSLKNKK